MCNYIYIILNILFKEAKMERTKEKTQNYIKKKNMTNEDAQYLYEIGMRYKRHTRKKVSEYRAWKNRQAIKELEQRYDEIHGERLKNNLNEYWSMYRTINRDLKGILEETI